MLRCGVLLGRERLWVVGQRRVAVDVQLVEPCLGGIQCVDERRIGVARVDLGLELRHGIPKVFDLVLGRRTRVVAASMLAFRLFRASVVA